MLYLGFLIYVSLSLYKFLNLFIHMYVCSMSEREE